MFQFKELKKKIWFISAKDNFFLQIKNIRSNQNLQGKHKEILLIYQNLYKAWNLAKKTLRLLAKLYKKVEKNRVNVEPNLVIEPIYRTRKEMAEFYVFWDSLYKYKVGSYSFLRLSKKSLTTTVYIYTIYPFSLLEFKRLKPNKVSFIIY